MRKRSQRAQTWTSMTTEYQERFGPPRCHVAVITQKDPNHPLKVSSTDLPTIGSYYVTRKWIKSPSVLPKCSSAPHKPVWFVENPLGSKAEDYTSVYQNEFRAWKANKQHPFKLTDCLKVNQGLVVPDCASSERCAQTGSVQDAAKSKVVPQVQEPPFESITSYRSDYVTHPVQPRRRREKPVYQPNKRLSLEPAESMRSKVTWGINQQLFDEANEFRHQCKTLSPETKFHGQVKAKESSPPVDDTFRPTAHADNAAHKCHHTKPLLPSMQTGEKNKKPFQATTTMKEDYKAWNTQRRLPTVYKDTKTHPKPSNLHPELDGTVVCNSSCDAHDKP